MKNSITILLTLALGLPLSGCAFVRMFDNEANSMGATRMLKKNKYWGVKANFERIDPRDLFDPEGGESAIDKALRDLYEDMKDKNTTERRLARSRIQERLLSASTQRCEAFKKKLQRFEGDVNFFLGSVTTALAGAGAIVTTERGARILAGLAGITSGVRAEFNSDYFKNLSIEVITKGINSRRQRQLDAMHERRCQPLHDYTILAAVRDALEYHGSCSIISGLEEASDSITQIQDPGLIRLESTLKRSKLLRKEISEALKDEPEVTKQELLAPSVTAEKSGTAEEQKASEESETTEESKTTEEPEIAKADANKLEANCPVGQLAENARRAIPRAGSA